MTIGGYFEADKPMDIAIVGSGISGLSAACRCAPDAAA